MFRVFSAAVAVAAALLVLPQQAQARAKVGMLVCDLSPTVGWVVGSVQGASCVFTPSGPGKRERYRGDIGRLGLDLGVVHGGRMVWAVFASYAGPQRGALRGTYLGAAGDASIGVGLGANVLVGGFERSFALQPVSFKSQAGVNVAVGVARLALY
ncbi:MAG: DUF992 domain-containing protein [Pseudorhodoplanes sp.]|nr:DUF992 domain-containing protein [Pseudorhodoplanes sp.]